MRRLSLQARRLLPLLAGALLAPVVSGLQRGTSDAGGQGLDGTPPTSPPVGVEIDAGPQAYVNQPPQIHFDRENGEYVFEGDSVRFGVTVTDPDGDRVALKLLNPPSGLVFDPVRGGLAPVTRQVSWLVLPGNGGPQRLWFEARDNGRPSQVVRAFLDVRVAGNSQVSGLMVGDVTGDGIDDVVGGASLADVGGVTNTGAIYVWAGASVPSGVPTATLSVPGAAAEDRLGLASGQGLFLADVTNDGVLDIVAASSGADVGGVFDAGAVYVFAGGGALTGSVTPTATLTVAGAVVLDGLASSDGQGIQVGDVTGNGALDLVVGAELADVAGVVDAGAVYVWQGGVGLSGSPAPHATLTRPVPVAGDQLGDANGQGILLEDVTGDGVFDVIVGAQYADVGGVVDTGAVFVWEGGAALTGTPAPEATLRVAGAFPDDRLGVATGQAIQLADLTEDGVLDLVVGTYLADVSGLQDTGAVYLWEGGSGLTGTVSPLASFSFPGVEDQVGFVLTGQGVQIADVTGDGALDVVAVADSADVTGHLFSGVLHVWAGGAGVSGNKNPTATLFAGDSRAFDFLGRASGRGVRLVDLSGDGTLDVVAGAQFADDGTNNDTGAAYVWFGGPGLSGSLAPTATFRVPTALGSDKLGRAFQDALHAADVTGDGVLDLVIGAIEADGSVSDAGAIYVWHGSPTLTGTVAPSATLAVSGASLDDRLGFAAGQGILIADVSGSGTLDVIAAAQQADVGAPDAGAVYVFRGGPGMSGSVLPSATLRVAGAVASDRLGDTSETAVQLADVDGNGRLDLIVGAQRADIGGTADAGAVYVWLGQGSLLGTTTPSARLSVPGAASGDRLSFAAGRGVLLADVTGDGAIDILGGAQFADVGGVTDTGAAYLWNGPVTGDAAPLLTLSVPGAVSGDQLGR